MGPINEVMEEKQSFVREALNEYESALIAYALTFVRDLDRARDVVQDTFIRLYQQDIEKVRENLKSWLYTVCRNRALDVLRKDKRLVGLEDEQLIKFPSGRRNPAERADLQERMTQVREALNRLSDNQREVILLKFEQGLSYEEISEVTGLSNGNVGFLLHNGLKRLRSLLPDDLLHNLTPQTA